MSADPPEIIGYDGPGVAGAMVVGATWEDDPATPAAAADDDQTTTGAPPRQEESKT